MKRTAIFGAALACALGLGALVPSGARAEYLGYPDLSAGAWYASVVDWCEESGAINGFSDGTWQPGTVVDRGMAATILWNYSGNPDPGEPADFADAGSLAYAADACAWAQDEGIFEGNVQPDGTHRMDPWDELSREQAAKVICQLVGGADGDPADLDGFPDGDDVSEWAVGPVSWAVGEGVISGKAGDGGIIDPQASCTRAEFAAMLMRATSGEDDPGTPPGPGGDEGDPAPDPGEGDPGDPDSGGGQDVPAEPEGPDTGGGDDVDDYYDLGNGLYTLTDGNDGTGDGETSSIWYDGFELYNLQPNFATVRGPDGEKLECAGANLAEPPYDFSVEKTVDLDNDTVTVVATGMGRYHGSLTITVRLVRFTSLYTGGPVCGYCNKTSWGMDYYYLGSRDNLDAEHPRLVAYRCKDGADFEAGFGGVYCPTVNGKRLGDIVVTGSTKDDSVLASDEEILSVPLYCRNPNCPSYGKDASDRAYIGWIGPIDGRDSGYHVVFHTEA